MYYYCPHFKSRVNIALLSFCSVLLPVVTSFTEKELIFFSNFHVLLLVWPSITCFAVCYLFVPVLPFVLCFLLLVLPSVTCLYLYCHLLGLLPSKYPLLTVLPSVFSDSQVCPICQEKILVTGLSFLSLSNQELCKQLKLIQVTRINVKRIFCIKENYYVVVFYKKKFCIPMFSVILNCVNIWIQPVVLQRNRWLAFRGHFCVWNNVCWWI